VRQVQELIQQRIGKGQGRKFHEAIFPGLFTSPFGQAGEHGRLNWSKIQVSVNGDLASVRIDAPDAMDFKLRRVDGQWYLTGDYYLRRAGADGLTWYSREFKRHIQTLEGVEADVESGVITKGNFDKRFQKPK